MPETYPQPIVTVDVVLLTLREEALCTALVRRDRAPHEGAWSLPGGWVHTDEDPDCRGAAVRILRAKAGLTSPYLEQLHTFSGSHRDSRGWSVSVVYYALVPYEGVVDAQSERLKWVPVSEARGLPFDHRQMLELAVARVRSKSLYSSLPIHLMPKHFTLGELQRIYELLLGDTLDKRGFRRRIEELDVVEEVRGQLSSGGAHRPAQLYRVKRRAAHELSLADKNLATRS